MLLLCEAIDFLGEGLEFLLVGGARLHCGFDDGDRFGEPFLLDQKVDVSRYGLRAFGSDLRSEAKSFLSLGGLLVMQEERGLFGGHLAVGLARLKRTRRFLIGRKFLR